MIQRCGALGPPAVRRCLLRGLGSNATPGAEPAPKRRMLELCLVRHGQSEGNVAYAKSVRGDNSLYSGEFLNRHSSLWRLTDRGRREAAEAGRWLRRHGDTFDAYYTSEFLQVAASPAGAARARSLGRSRRGRSLARGARHEGRGGARARARRRAMETAALLDMEGARWYTETNCRERDWGQWDLRSKSEWDRSEDQRRRRHGLYFAPPGGESLAAVLLRVDLILNYLHGRYHGRRVLMVCHGELMWAFRLRFEKLNQIQYRDMADVARGDERIHNARARVRRPPRPTTVPKPRPSDPGPSRRPSLAGPRREEPLRAT